MKLTPSDVPNDVHEAAIKVQLFFEQQGITHWEYLGLASRWNKVIILEQVLNALSDENTDPASLKRAEAINAITQSFSLDHTIADGLLQEREAR